MKLHLHISLLTAVLATAINYAEAAAYDSEYDRYYDVEPAQMTGLLYNSGGTSIDLSQESFIEAADLNLENYTRMQDLVYRDGAYRPSGEGDTSPGVFTASFNLELTSIEAGNIFSIAARPPHGDLLTNTYDFPLNAFGLSLTKDGILRFSRNSYRTEVADNIVEIGTLSVGTVYEVTLTSIAQPLFTTNGNLSSSGDNMYIGRGDSNFIITVTGEDYSQTITTAGFGLNGVEFNQIVIGDSESDMEGSISNLVIKTIPEPTTSILCLLSFAAMAYRRRR